jgi:hypothetical protein
MNPAKEEQFEASPPADVDRARPAHSVAKIVRTELAITSCVYCFFVIGALIATHRAHGGVAYELEPAGIGIVYEIASGVIFLGLCCAFYLLPMLSVRRSIGCALRAVMFSIMVAALTWLQTDKAVLVVEQPNSYQFVRPWPFGMTVVNKDRIVVCEVTETSLMRSVRVEVRGGRFGNQSLELRPIWRRDSQTMKICDNLLDALAKTGVPITRRESAASRQRFQAFHNP